jgi:predicted metallopeptidase
VIRIASTIIELPEYIEIEFTKLRTYYGELLLDPRFKSRIRLDESLSSREVIAPIVHELLHLNQVHTGRLRHARHGVYWDGKHHDVRLDEKNHKIYSSFPWEVDVAEKQQKLLEQILETYG